ncbi:MAG: chromosome partitioning protein ParB, partial [Eggerthella lenta]
ISQLPNQKQLDLFVEYQRQEMTLGQLKAHLKASRPKTTADASRALQAAIRSVEEARRMDREGVPLSQGLIRKLKSLVDQL